MHAINLANWSQLDSASAHIRDIAANGITRAANLRGSSGEGAGEEREGHVTAYRCTIRGRMFRERHALVNIGTAANERSNPSNVTLSSRKITCRRESSFHE